jgi:hypothetical protein
MSWADYLDDVDTVASEAARALGRGDAVSAAAELRGLEQRRVQRQLPALPTTEADRARAAIGRLAALDLTVSRALARLEPERALLERARSDGRAPEFFDLSA